VRYNIYFPKESAVFSLYYFSQKLLKHLQEEEQSNVVCSSSINKERVESELIEGVST